MDGTHSVEFVSLDGIIYCHVHTSHPEQSRIHSETFSIKSRLNERERERESGTKKMENIQDERSFLSKISCGSLNDRPQQLHGFSGGQAGGRLMNSYRMIFGLFHSKYTIEPPDGPI